MSKLTLSFSALLLVITFLAMLDLPSVSAEYPGVIELVGFSNRRARTHYMPVSFSGRALDIPTISPPASKTQADIETVKQNIEKYNKLLTLDTKNLPESQKDMLERIVERVARLKESLDVEQTTAQDAKNRTQQQLDDIAANTAATTEVTTAEAEAETDSTLVLDETTLLQLQNSMDELAAAQAAVTAQTTRMNDVPTTAAAPTESDPDAAAATISDDLEGGTPAYETTTDPQLTDATDIDDQFVAARSNNRNIAAITAADEPLATGVFGGGASSTPLSTTAGNARRTSSLTTSGKIQKTRATKRPSSASTASKRVTGQQRPGGGTTAALSHKQSMTTKQKLAAAAAAVASMTTTQQKYKTPVTAATPANDQLYQRTPQAGLPSSLSAASTASGATYGGANGASGSGSGVVGAGVGGNDIVYDPHVNTSAIIDSLNHAREEFYQQKQTVNGKDKDKKTSATAKPTKYHYYPHNQHIYLLPECAIQQVCNAVYVRLNYTQPLCACPSRYRDPCSASLNEDDQHTTKLVGDGKKKAITLAKTCEATTEMRECRSPKDWSLLALQNTRTGKSHYLVICRCPDHFKMEGPMAHDQPTYASVPGIRVFGMMCVKPGYSVRKQSVQPPKRYQLQKPFYRPTSQNPTFGSNQYTNKDAYGRPTYGGASLSTSTSSNNGYHQQHGQDSFQNQQQANYQYLNRPESHGSVSSNNYHPESISLNTFNGGGIYGRNNERKGDTPIQAASASDAEETEAPEPKTTGANTSTPAAAEARTTFSEESNTGGISMEAVPLSSSSAEGKREKRSVVVEDLTDLEDDSQIPEFPWNRVIEFQQSIIWD